MGLAPHHVIRFLKLNNNIDILVLKDQAKREIVQEIEKLKQKLRQLKKD